MLHAIVREVSASMADCQLSFVQREPLDIALARVQHHAYQQALLALGCKLTVLPAQDTLPDSVFVEDVALVLDELAIMTRPGAPSRRAEGTSVAEALARVRTLEHIVEPGTLDGGDILRIDRDIYVGQSARSNSAAMAQLRELVAPHGYQVHAVPMQDCLHLKSAVTQIAERTLLIQPAWVDRQVFADYTQIEIDPSEPHAANTLRIGMQLVYPSGFPRTQARIEQAGIAVHNVELSELQKAEGAVTCCSLIYQSNA